MSEHNLDEDGIGEQNQFADGRDQLQQDHDALYLKWRNCHQAVIDGEAELDALKRENELLRAVVDAATEWRCDENAECDSASTLKLCNALDAWTNRGDSNDGA